jgi:hypothetical protein
VPLARTFVILLDDFKQYWTFHYSALQRCSFDIELDSIRPIYTYNTKLPSLLPSAGLQPFGTLGRRHAAITDNTQRRGHCWQASHLQEFPLKIKIEDVRCLVPPGAAPLPK